MATSLFFILTTGSQIVSQVVGPWRHDRKKAPGMVKNLNRFRTNSIGACPARRQNEDWYGNVSPQRFSPKISLTSSKLRDVMRVKGERSILDFAGSADPPRVRRSKQNPPNPVLNPNEPHSMPLLFSNRRFVIASLCVCLTLGSILTPHPLAAQESNDVSAEGQAEIDETERTPAETKLKFSFRHAPWEDVLQWLAEESDLSFSTDVIPTGTFNYIDEDQVFTPKQAIDLVNGYLLIKGYTIVRKGKLLLVIDLEDELDAQLVRDLLVETPNDELKDRGEYEITKTRFNLEHVDAAEAEQQISQLLSPVGSVIVMPGAKQILATETGGTLRMIEEVLESLEKTAKEAEKGKLHAFTLKIASADEVLAVARPLLDIDDDEFSSEDGTIRVSADPLGRTVFATGDPEKIKLVEQIVNQVDARDDTADGANAVEASQFMSHRVASTDPQAVLRVLQTLFVGDPAIRLEIDTSTGGIIAFATPTQHRSIKATIEEMELNPERMKVIPLRYTDPAAAVVLVEKLFSNSQKPPIVDGTLVPPQLVVRGSEAQIEQIRVLLDDIGERRGGAFAGAGGTPRTGNVRMIPMSPAAASAAIDRIRAIWPDLRPNELKVMPPQREDSILQMQPLRSGPRSQGPDRGVPARKSNVEEPAKDAGENPREAQRDARVSTPSRQSFKTRAVTQLEQIAGDEETSGDGTNEPGLADDAPSRPPVVIATTPEGLMISSDDTEALNAIQSLMEAFAASSSAGPRFNLFYLKHIEAEAAVTLVTNILNGLAGPTVVTPTSTSDSSVPSVLQQQSSALATELPSIVADKRLNALFVSGEPGQVAMVRQLLQVIDIESGPEEVLTFPRPQFIPVVNTDAESVANVLRQVYANRIETGNNNNNNNRQNESRDRGGFGRGFPGFFGRGGDDDRRGGRGNGGNNQQAAAGDLPKMTIGVDNESNSIVVSAPGPLLKEVESVVEELDRRAAEKPPEVIEVVNLKRTDPYLVQQTLVGVLGELVETSTPSNSSANGDRSSATSRVSAPGANFGRGGQFGSAGGAATANDVINRFRSSQGFSGRDRGSRGGDRGGRGGGDRGGRGGDRGGRGN